MASESPVYIPSPTERLLAFQQGLTTRFHPKQDLVVGPYVGEFGIEIMNFQSYVRWLVPRFRRVLVLTYPGREPMYQGCEVFSHDLNLRNAGYYYGKMSFSEIEARARSFAKDMGLNAYSWFSTNMLCSRLHRRLLWKQTHEPFASRERTPEAPVMDVLFHFRAMQKDGPDQSRNISPDLAQTLVEESLSKGLNVGCIGHPDQSICPEGAKDLRTVNLDETVGAITHSRLVAGELSGPIHLAVYCAKPVMFWAPGADRVQPALRRNPFQVPCLVVADDTTNPPAAKVLDQLFTFLG